MKNTKKFYSLWLSITLTNVVSLSMVFFSIKTTLKESYKILSSSLDTRINSSRNLEIDDQRPKIVSQSQKLRNKNSVSVAIIDDKAYWVYDNTFYVSDYADGEIDRDSATPVDAHSLSEQEFGTLLEILDGLNK